MAFPSLSKYRISRRGRKLLANDDQKILSTLPKDVAERTWAEVLQKEDNDLFILNIREEIVERALDTVYEAYMEKQTARFAVHCAAQAWLRLIDWEFYRHDPGEDPSAYPPCYIPHRAESWEPDEPPEPSPKDTWCKQNLPVLEECSDEAPQKRGSATSLEFPVVEEIPSEYWFPGKIDVPEELRWRSKKLEDEKLSASISTTYTSSSEFAAESEVLQKITDYSSEEMSVEVSKASVLAKESKLGAGDSPAVARRTTRTSEKTRARKQLERSKLLSRASVTGRSRGSLPPLEDSVSSANIISDCRLRSLRIETQYEISSEKMDSPSAETTRRK